MSQIRRRVNPEIREFWRKLDPRMSLDRLWYGLNTRAGAAGSTVEALVLSLRAGITALSERAILHRLCELSDHQFYEVAVRLQKFPSHIAPAWTAQQIEVLAAIRRKLS
jgi:hypothetical protein